MPSKIRIYKIFKMSQIFRIGKIFKCLKYLEQAKYLEQIYHKEMSSQNILKESLISQNQKDQRQQEQGQQVFDKLDTIKIYAYGVGHFFNDLLGALWFNFLFFYLKRVVKTEAATIALVIGQICDGIVTPLVGVLSDKFKSDKYGQRIPWYFVGFIIVFASFINLWQGFKSTDSWEYVYYIFFSCSSNLGWAMVQISHMSLAPALTCSRKRRDKLNNLRNSFSFLANLTVLGVGSFIFALMNDPLSQYRLISYLIGGIGVASSFFFLWHIKQVELCTFAKQRASILKQKVQQEKQKSSTNISTKISSEQKIKQQKFVEKSIKSQENLQQDKSYSYELKQWFKLPKFYLFGICYMGVRLYTNMFGTFLPFFIQGVLALGIDQKTNLDQHIPFSVALVPLVVYSASSIVTPFLNKFYVTFGRKKALFTGTIIACISSICMYYLQSSTNYLMYLVAITVGISQSMVLSTGINLISDVVGSRTKVGAFVFGCYSLFDKFSAGLVIYLIGNSTAYSKQISKLDDSQKGFIRNTFIFIPVCACILSSIIVLFQRIEEYTNKTLNDKTKKSLLQTELVY